MKKEKGLSGQILKNNLYAVKMAFSISKARVILTVLVKILEHVIWVFYSAFFVRFILDAIQNEKPLKEILTAIGIIGGVSLLLQLFLHLCYEYFFPLQDVKITHGLYKKVYKKSENVELGCYEKSDFYDKFSIALDDMGTKLSEAVTNLSVVIGGTIGGILACYTMIEIDPFTIIFLIAPFIGNFFFAPRLNKIDYGRYRDGVPYERKMGYVNRVMYLPEYAKEFRLSNVFNVIRTHYEKAVDGKASVWKKYFNKAFWLGIFQYIFSYVIIFEGILLYGAYKAIVPQKNMISFAQMAVLTSVMITASWVWVRVINAFNKGTQSSILVANLKIFMEYKETIPEDYDGIMPDDKIQSIEFRNVSFSYDGIKNVVKDLSFVIDGNKRMVLVGHNGAGKTTIVKLLLRLYDPTEGEVLVNGINIKEYNLKAYRKLFACAFQDGVLFPGTVKHNILMGREGSDEEVICALKQAGVYEKIESFKEGINTQLTKEFIQSGEILSGGETQKVVVARAFAAGAPAVIFDEPSSALDPIAENELFMSILEATKHKAALLISHRLSCVKDADYVLMLEQGQIIERGTHDSLMELSGKYAAMYRMQEKNYFAQDAEDMEGYAYEQ